MKVANFSTWLKLLAVTKHSKNSLKILIYKIKNSTAGNISKHMCACFLLRNAIISLLVAYCQCYQTCLCKIAQKIVRKVHKSKIISKKMTFGNSEVCKETLFLSVILESCYCTFQITLGKMTHKCFILDFPAKNIFVQNKLFWSYKIKGVLMHILARFCIY